MFYTFKHNFGRKSSKTPLCHEWHISFCINLFFTLHSSLFNCLKKKKLITMYNCTCLTISTNWTKHFNPDIAGISGWREPGSTRTSLELHFCTESEYPFGESKSNYRTPKFDKQIRIFKANENQISPKLKYFKVIKAAGQLKSRHVKQRAQLIMMVKIYVYFSTI